MLKPKGSWKTSTAGVCAFVGAVAYALHAHYDSDPFTVPQWEGVAAGFFAMIGLFAARDNNVTSEQVKAGSK
jgi:hypothetical protein